MAAMNYSGILLASKAVEQDIDKYEEDEPLEEDGEVNEAAKRRKNSNIQFKPLNEWKDVKEWSYELKNSEQVECIAIGSGWCVAYTNFNYLRVFSNDGIQRHLMCQGTPVVTMTGYENILAVIYHAGPSIFGC